MALVRRLVFSYWNIVLNYWHSGKQMNKGSCCLCTRISNDRIAATAAAAAGAEKAAAEKYPHNTTQYYKCTEHIRSICIAMVHELRYVNSKVSEWQREHRRRHRFWRHQQRRRPLNEQQQKWRWLQFLFSIRSRSIQFICLPEFAHSLLGSVCRWLLHRLFHILHADSAASLNNVSFYNVASIENCLNHNRTSSLSHSP